MNTQRNCPPGTVKYIVKQGDTFEKIAEAHGIKTPDLTMYNKHAAGKTLMPGDELCVPSIGISCENGSFYTLKRGDTLVSIARRNGLFLKTLLSANPYLNPGNYMEGQVICIPETSACPDGTEIYRLLKNETIVDVMNKFNMSLQALAGYNPDIDVARVKEGDELCVIEGPHSGLCPGGRLYTIADGDTLESIAKKNQISVEHLVSVNAGLLPSDYVSGRTICLPVFMFKD